MANTRQQQHTIESAARKYGIDPHVLWGVFGAESNFGRNKNNSSAGAQGPFQFMPATARGMGINPHNFRQAAFGAARYLSQYKDRGVEGMLAAYNAGPAGNPNNAETRAYIPRVLQLAKTYQGGTGKERGSGRGATPRAGAAPTAASYTGAVDNSAMRTQLKAQYLLNRNDPNALLQLATGLQGAQDQPGTLHYQPKGQQPAASSSPSSAKTPHGKGKLLELFWQGAGGINAKNGKKVPQGFVSGHKDHVHVAAGPKTVIELGHLAQKMGLHVGENPKFGGVEPVHVSGSYHYKNEAIDVSGPPALMREYAHRVATMYGVR